MQGVLEAIRISCAGYPTRKSFFEFSNRFGLLVPEVQEGKYVLARAPNYIKNISFNIPSLKYW